MATVACSGCGLPRVQAQIDSTPCPVCHAAPVQPARTKSVTRPAAPDPTTDLPADVSELDKRSQAKRSGLASARPAILIAFLTGIVLGAGGVLGWQARIESDRPSYPLVNAADTSAPSLQHGTKLQIAPLPREARSHGRASIIKSESTGSSLPPMRAIVIDLNQPDAAYTVPFSMKKGEHVIIRGKVKTLRANGMEAGAVLDASGLEAGSVFIGGTIAGRSNLRLNAPNGAVTIAANVTGNSQVEINAVGGTVRFLLPTTASQPGSRIDGGSNLALLASTIELCGDVSGADTRVGATLPPGGVLKVAAIRGTAAVEFSVEPEGGIAPDVNVGFVAPTATLKRLN